MAASRGATAPPTFITVETATAMLQDWGFLAEPDLPDVTGPAYLLVALRTAPTLRHYDPEVVNYWVSDKGHGVPVTLSRSTILPLATDFSWGVIRIVDRLGVANEYVTFGGRLTAERVEDACIAVFESPVPLLRRGGHSQGWDVGASSLAAFFGRFLLAVDIVPGFEARAAAADPITRYAAFIEDVLGRCRRSPSLRERRASLWQLVRSEAGRLEREHPLEWRMRMDLIRDLSS
jgi:hypothetical protein